ncbi:MAG: signal peptide peptidase SppA [Bacteroides sp.]|nr:signal peptide peptidase SppA [Bacteroides sp.]MCM1456351.1 signal peptide peptidase SppA [Lachnoclostridium sp.]
MIKKFFLTMLGTIAGIWVSIIVFVLGSIIAIGILVGKNADTSAIAGGDSILRIDLSGQIVDRVQPGSFMDVLMSASEGNTQGLDDLVAAIMKARDDKKIKGIFLDCSGSSSGIATRAELLEALRYFKEDSSKWIYSYADSYAQGDYLLASVSDKIYLNPIGEVDIHGLQSMVMFYKGLMDKLGVEMQVVKVGTFKSAVEPFLRTDMSEANREQTRIYVDQIWGDIAGNIAANLSLTPADVNLWADSLASTWAPEIYVDRKMVSELKYRSEVEEILRKQMKLDKDDKLPYVSPSEYLASKIDPFESKGKHIAVLYAVGDIVVSGEGGIVSETLVPQIEKLAADDDVKGLVLRVNSGGGSAFASEQIWKALEDFKAKDKPFYVSMGDYAASGGYYISCGADSIFADATTLTGSIGIFGMIPSAEKLLNDKLGLTTDIVASNPNAVVAAPYRPYSPTQIAAMQRYVERGYATFTGRVAEGRKMEIDSVLKIAEGRVWDGQSALRIGLVDKIGSLQYAIDAMARRLDMKPYETVSYPALEEDFWATVLKESQNMSVEINGIPAEDIATALRAARALRDADPIQARMEPTVLR